MKRSFHDARSAVVSWTPPVRPTEGFQFDDTALRNVLKAARSGDFRPDRAAFAFSSFVIYLSRPSLTLARRASEGAQIDPSLTLRARFLEAANML